MTMYMEVNIYIENTQGVQLELGNNEPDQSTLLISECFCLEEPSKFAQGREFSVRSSV